MQTSKRKRITAQRPVYCAGMTVAKPIQYIYLGRVVTSTSPALDRFERKRLAGLGYQSYLPSRNNGDSYRLLSTSPAQNDYKPL